MADRIYGIQQSQPHDVYAYVKANAEKVGSNVKAYMLSDYPGSVEPGSTQVIFDDEPQFFDEVLLDGRTRRYSLVTVYIATIEPRAFSGQTDLALDGVAKLGYSTATTTTAFANPAAFGAGIGRSAGDVSQISGASKVTILAGVPRYFGPEETPEDVPQDGSQYARTSTGWAPIDLSQYETIQGTNDKIDAALGSSFNGRNVLLTSDTAVFADGEGAVSDPTGGTGWYYTNTQGNKINWYFYSGGSDSETLGALQAADGGYYMLVDARNNTSWPYLTIYTPRLNDGNDTSWYRSRLVYGPGGNYSNKLSQGLHICHTPNLAQSVKDGLATKFPTATFTSLDLDAISTVGPQGGTEELWLVAVSTSSNEPAGQEAFVLRENALFFGGKARSYQYAAIPTQQPEYTNYYKGAYAAEADYPESGALGQWIINSTDDTILVWDVEGGAWEATGSGAAAPTSAVQDYPFQYVYSSLDGSGYGFSNAYPASNWSNTPDGKLQSTGFSSDILSRQIKFATLKNPGDQVTVQVSNNTTAYYRFGVYGIEPGTDISTLSWKVAGQPANGTTWMLNDQADRDLVRMQVSYMEPYWGGTSYGYNMTGRSNSTGLGGLVGNQGELPITFRVADDYAIEMYIDGHYHVRTQIIPVAGVDLYFHMYGETGRVLEQPTGNGMNFIGGTAPNATGARYYMSDAAPSRTEATILDSGNGYWLYSDTEASGTGYNVELTDTEASQARFCRVFTDYTGMTLQERADSTLPIATADETGLNRVEYLARGYFHSLDLSVLEIQEKMALYADALAAATAGSVEVCLATLQSLQIPTAGSAGTLAFTPNYTFDGTNVNTASQAYYSGDALYDTYGIDELDFSDSFITIHFKDSASFNAWRSQDREITIDYPSGTETWEATHALTTSVEYSVSTQYNYVHYQPTSLSSAERTDLADTLASAGAGTSVINVTLGAPTPQSPAAALGEQAVVNELIAILQLHLQKFPR